jgi:phospholipid/cholesterol/gamma-HCH transport system permease protein
MIGDAISHFGSRITDAIDGLGAFTRFCLSALGWFFRGVTKWGRARILLPQLYSIGSKSVPVVMLVGAFVGMVLAVEAFDQFAAIGQEVRLGGIVNISVVRQIGPVLAAIMLAGRIGGSVSAELGTMKVTEQLDALRVMGADPVAHLVVPRVIACVVMIPALTIFSDMMGIYGGYLVTVTGFGVNAKDYWIFSGEYVEMWDVLTGLLKSLFFGLVIGLISCYKGFHCRPGAAGVGKAATDSFVTSFIAIIIINFFLAKFFQDLHPLFYGRSG